MDREAIQRKLQPCHLDIARLDESGNAPIEPNSFPLTWQDLHHPELARMIETCRLDEVIGTTHDELEQLLLLRNWVFHNIPRGMPEWNPDQPWLLVDLARNGRGFYCSHYADVLVHAATALGWPARHLGIDCDHAEGEMSTHHGITEVFSYEWDKWIALDAMFDVHFEHKGEPLSVLGLRNMLLAKGAKAIDRMVGPSRKKTRTRQDVAPSGFDHAGCYFWFHVPTRNNYFSQPAWQGNERSLLYIDDANRDKTWYQNRYGEKNAFLGSRLHSGLRTGRFLKTERTADIYPPLGRTHIDVDLSLPRSKDSPVLPVVLYTINPYWHSFEVRFDEAMPWVPVSRHVDWRLHAGRNVLEARLVTHPGRTGVAARVELTLRGNGRGKATGATRRKAIP
jgi:hypothetical protein